MSQINPHISKIMSNRNTLGILVLLGFLAIIFNIVLDTFSIDTGLWALAVLVGFQFYRLTETFTKTPNPQILDNLKRFRMIFIVTWALAAFFGILFWGFQLDILFGVLVVGGSTIVMGQIINEAQLFLGPQAAPGGYYSAPAPPAQSPPTQAPVSSLFCGQCGAQLEAGAKFCKECGAKV